MANVIIAIATVTTLEEQTSEFVALQFIGNKFLDLVMDRDKLKHMSKQRRLGLAAAYRDKRCRPALTYLANVSTLDVGVAQEFGCVIWLAFYCTHCRTKAVNVM